MSDIQKNLKNTYDAIAPRFDSTRKKPWKEVEQFINRQKKDTLILDLAAGTGRHTLYAKSRGLNPVAGDFSVGQLKQIRKKDKKIPLILLSLTSLPFKDDTFDSVICIAAIHHLETEKKRIKSLRESQRASKPGSEILASAWALDQPRFKNKPQDIHYTWDKKYPRFYHLFKNNELKETAKKAGLITIKEFRKKDNIYILSRKKATKGAH